MRWPRQKLEVFLALNLRHQTAAQFAARYWERVRAAQGSNKLELHRLLWALWRLVDVLGDVTHTQARNSYNNAFGKSLTAAQWTALWSARVIPAKDRYLALLAEGNIDG